MKRFDEYFQKKNDKIGIDNTITPTNLSGIDRKIAQAKILERKKKKNYIEYQGRAFNSSTPKLRN